MLVPHGYSDAGDGDGSESVVGAVILVVEDNPVIQKVAKLQLEELGHHVDIAVNGVEALESLHQNDYDLVLMDCHMEEMDGYEATRRIRQFDMERGTHTTIIAMTTQGLVGDRERCLDSGMDDYLLKPVSLDQMKCMLDKWL